MEAWVTAEPVLNHWVFVCRVIVDNQVQIKLFRGFPVDLFQKTVAIPGGYATLRFER